MSINTSNMIKQNYNNQTSVLSENKYNIVGNQHQTMTTNNNLATSPNFKGLDKDTVEISEKQNTEVSKGAKWILGAGLATLAGIGIYLATKGKASNNSAKQLAEKIDFSEAKTFNDVKKFGKEKLGINKYIGFREEDAEILNYFNEGLTTLSNKFKGKAELPETIAAAKFKDDKAIVAAGMHPQEKTLYINIEHYKNLKQKTSEYFNSLIENEWINEAGIFTKDAHSKFNEEDLKFFENVIKDYNRGICDFAKLDNFAHIQTNFYQHVDDVLNNPEKIIRNILSDSKNQTILKQKSYNYTNILNNLKNFTKDEQISIAKTLTKESGIPHFRENVEFETIFHEEMHLLDKSNLSKRPQNIYIYGCDYAKYPKELKEWIDNKEYQRIAKQISEYAASGPCEYVAEYGSMVLRNNPVSEEATALYKKLNGPELG